MYSFKKCIVLRNKNLKFWKTEIAIDKNKKLFEQKRKIRGDVASLISRATSEFQPIFFSLYKSPYNKGYK